MLGVNRQCSGNFLSFPLKDSKQCNKKSRVRVKVVQNEIQTVKPLIIPTDQNLNLELNELSAISPMDGRYGNQLIGLRNCMSEYGLIRWRVAIECLWLQWLQSVPTVGQSVGQFDALSNSEIERLAHGGLTVSEAQEIKQIEKITRHDVKAVEYWLKQKLSESTHQWLHFGCTSEDINNLSIAIMVRQATQNHVFPKQKEIIFELIDKSEDLAGAAMLARTHGQPASPTTMGKELAVFAWRLGRQFEQLKQVQPLGKMSGAVGNFNAHMVAFPEVQWRACARDFVTQVLGLKWSEVVIQIEAHDWLAELMDGLGRFDSVLLDMDRDMWGYISLGYFKQKSVAGEVGSSTMPHKVNPIDFENSEGNIGVAEAIQHHLSRKLLISRFQRDLTDSTVQRNIGVCLAHSVLAYNSCLKGLSKVEANEEKMREELQDSWEVLGEAVQTVMRRYGAADPYERLKEFSRGKAISKDQLQKFVATLDEIPDEAKKQLTSLTPELYVGDAYEQAMGVRQLVTPLLR